VARAGNEVAQQVARLKRDPKAHAAARSLAAAAVESLDACCRPLGLMQAPAAEFFDRARTRRLRLRGLDAAAIDAKVGERTAAREAKDFGRSDAIRAELAQLGVELQDVPGGGGTSWRVVV
jgi:cysteinyl-tRNA synthetase